MHTLRALALATAILAASGAGLAPDARAGSDLGALATGELRNFIVSDPPRPAAPAEFRGSADETLTLADFRGKVVLVNLWATWCAPCREEMPSLDRLQAALGGQDFQVVAISQDRGGKAKAGAFLQETGSRHLGLYVDQTMRSARTWGAVGLPTTLLIDRQGREVGRLVGPAEWDSAEARRLIETVMADGDADRAEAE